MENSTPSVSIVLPAKNESDSLATLLPELRRQLPDAEIIVVDDGSTDDTRGVCAAQKVNVISHPYSMGNGAAIKSGARHATGEVLVFMDADGQHNPTDVKRLLQRLSQGYDMVVGARTPGSQASLGRAGANRFYNFLATIITGHKIQDLTSGLRAVKAKLFNEFLFLLPNGFSYPTTITMAFFRAGYTVAYEPIQTQKRVGKSHLSPLRDGIRFLVIIFKIGTLYSPLKIFFPASMLFFITGICYYGYTYITASRFTNMSALLFITSVTVFLIGLVSEQVTSLLYSRE